MEPGASRLPLLLHQSWLPADIGGRRLLTKSWFGETEYQILMTDLQCVWQESMDTAAIQRRAQVRPSQGPMLPFGPFLINFSAFLSGAEQTSEGAGRSFLLPPA